ncbi:hypothetical protein ACIPF8_19065 [Collimonas sp. NPDC087041]|uniref:hypothetical protein n=1 Tax=Collimonas sp. NPDC087041 TaxID=3363960 RepID=UPI0038044588
MSNAIRKWPRQLSGTTPVSRKMPRRPAKGPSPIEELFNFQVRALQLPVVTREHQFHPTREWRIDFAWPDRKLAIEIEGGIWTQGRHTRGAGMRADMEKYNAMAEMGWALLRFDSTAVSSGAAIKQVERFFQENRK